jgi:anthranilate/para-aminobenzoate synthase component I
VTTSAIEREIETRAGAVAWCRAHRRAADCSVLLDGAGAPDAPAWTTLVGIDNRPSLCWTRGDDAVETVLDRLDRRIRLRRRDGGSRGTGVLVMLGHDLFDSREPPPGEALPDLVAVDVEASVRFPRDGQPVFSRSARSRVEPRRAESGDRSIDNEPIGSFRPTSAPTTSLSREAYLDAVEKVQWHIAQGDIYQANLTQRFSVEVEGDPLELYERLQRAAPAPRSAFVEAAGVTLVSVSPETFLRIDPEGVVETWPIKGTRPRGADARKDQALRRELWASEKDRAELTMIVDLERNDLGRICQTGSIEVPTVAELRTFAAVHHLVGHVRGKLLDETGPREWIRATFPGGSISGAPKLRALEILSGLEPLPRNFYTGSLLWFGDDGSVESSILIRTVVVAGGVAHLGAGGGVVADSDPESEWLEANHKVRPLARELGFDPVEAI